MKKLNSVLLIILLVFITNHLSNAQSKTGRYLVGVGVSYFADFQMSPYYAIPANNSNPVSTSAEREYSVSVFSMSMANNIKIVNLGTENSISALVSPTFRLSVGLNSALGYSSNAGSGFGSAAMPMFLTFNHGLLSTMETNKDMGFSFGLGAVPATTSFLKLSDRASIGTRVFWTPAVRLGMRYWSGEKVNDLSLTVGYANHKSVEFYDVSTNYSTFPSSNIYTRNTSTDQKNTSLIVTLTLTKYINY